MKNILKRNRQELILALEVGIIGAFHVRVID
mgnify:CR=1 FL=1